MARTKNASLATSPRPSKKRAAYSIKRANFKKSSTKKNANLLTKKSAKAIDLAEAIKLARGYLKVIAPDAKNFEVEGVRGDNYRNWVIIIGYEGPKEKQRGKILPFTKKKYKMVTINSKGQLISIEYF